MLQRDMWPPHWMGPVWGAALCYMKYVFPQLPGAVGGGDGGDWCLSSAATLWGVTDNSRPYDVQQQQWTVLLAATAGGGVIQVRHLL